MGEVTKRYALVYQAGLANVFSVENSLDPHAEGHLVNGYENYAKRVRQADFAACENYAAGLSAAGAEVYVLHCNLAGDIGRADWSWNIDDAPFRENMHIPCGAIGRADAFERGVDEAERTL